MLAQAVQNLTEAHVNVAILGGNNQKLRSVPLDGEQFVAVLGGMNINLREANMPEALKLSVFAVLGGVNVYVPRGTDVVFSGFSLFGGRRFQPQHDHTEIRSVLYLAAVSVFGGVNVIEADS